MWLMALPAKKSTDSAPGPWVPNLAFPEGENIPAFSMEMFFIGFVPELILAQLWSPIGQPRFGDVGIDAIPVLVPETPPYLDDPFQAAKNQVRLTWEFRDVEPVSESKAMNEPSHDHFGRGAFRPNSPHVLGALFACQ